ncbi:MAG: hypothetical protein JWM16_1468 [Verrucomicrobiales bacterium]|nr:hypothetical protein [Verrucomicrobiales bacterium]
MAAGPEFCLLGADLPTPHKTVKHYQAPWDTLLIVLSSLLTALCLGIAFVAWNHGGKPFWVGPLMLAFVLGCALFAIRGYTITPDAILVHRLFWKTRLPLLGLNSAKFEPNAMRWSIRTFGNGGFFSYSGFYRNKALGGYRALVTDRHLTVVLRFSRRTVVVSPASPEQFAAEFASPPAAHS